MLKRTSLLAAAHLVAAIGFVYFAGTFSARNQVLQFFGHLGPAILFASAGLISISGRLETPRLIRIEAYLALVLASLYLLIDTFIIHPPFGIFDGAGTTEQQHVSLYLMLGGLGAFVLATLRYTKVLPSIQILIAATAFGVVFSGHAQHNEVSMVAHNATTVFLVLAGVLRLLDRTFEYGVLLLIAAHTLFSGQIGLTGFAEEVGVDPTTWSAYWITAGCLAVAAYLAAMKGDRPDIL
jgi:hypothetical protein